MERLQSDISRDSEGQWVWNLESHRVHFSPRWMSLVGCEEHEVGNTQAAWLTRVHPDDLGRVSAAVDAGVAHGGPSDFDVPHRLLHKDGSYRWMSCRGIVQRNAAGVSTRVVGSHADVTGDTVIDQDTGLPNRLLLSEHLARSIERSKRYDGFHFALLVVDLDRPDHQGAPAGAATDDPLLVAAARRLETCLRVGDSPATLRHNDVVARLQGDQFAILLDGLKEVGDAGVVADRMLAELRAPFTTRDREVFLSASIGIAVSATGYPAPEAMLRDAEAALHRARLLGKARYEFFDTAILKTRRTELQLAADFHQALERREFQVFYQPVVSLASNTIAGWEALARWQHPILGMISPLDFIPLAEKTGFIVLLGRWILHEACVQLKAWQHLPGVADDLWVSVNVSGVQLLHPPLVDDIEQALADAGLDPRRLVIELTEGIAIERPVAVKAVLMRLRALGIRISVDDFGTGHSSLASLRQFPIDCLKVDRSFVRGIEASADMAGILGTVSAMARQLGLLVVIEGVENEAQLALVRPLHCDYVQGYIFSKPLDRTRATLLLETGLPLRPADSIGASAATATHTGHDPQRSAGQRRPVTLAYAVAGLVLVSSLALALQLRQGQGNGDRSETPAPSPAAPASPDGFTAGDAAAAAGAPPSSAAPQVPVATRVVSGGAAAVPPPPAVKGLTSLRVVHQHRLGSCRGRLLVSRQGVEFVPDDSDQKDAFRFTYQQFVQELTGDGLTLRSGGRTFRFKAATASAPGGGDLPALADSMARRR